MILDSCKLTPVRFLNSSYSEAGPLAFVEWNFGDGKLSSDYNTEHSYVKPGKYAVKMTVEDENKCIDQQVSNINYFPVPDKFNILPSQYIGCTPVTINFNNLTEFIDDQYTVSWDFGDGTYSNNTSPSHLYEEPGEYSIKVKVQSPTGCELSTEYTDLLIIKKGPKANFTVQPEKVSIINPAISLINSSSGGNYHFWEFGTGDISYEFEPKYVYTDTGLYKITYILTSANNCTDTLTKYVDVSPDVLMFYPNAFTPNGDGTNDEFFGKGSFIKYMQGFNLSIFDRWGGLVFDTDDPLEYWNGRKFNSGDVLPQGVYVYIYAYSTPRGKLISDKGFVTLIK
jgi:gliding motility-associated-like protein